VTSIEETIIGQPQTIVLIAIALLILTYSAFAIAYTAASWLRLQHKIAAPGYLTDTIHWFS